MIVSRELDWRFGTIEVPAADRYIREAIEVTGEYGGHEIDLYQGLLGPGDVAVDVGANIGVFTIAMGLAVGPAGRVLAFEPQPSIFEMLQRNLDRHALAQVEPHRAIILEAAGRARFVDIRNVPDGRTVNFGMIGVTTRVGGEHGVMTPTSVRSIDGLALARCALIKIDVEGAEDAVLAGSSATLARCRPVLSVECDRPNASSPWVDPLLATGYHLWRFRGPNMREPNPKGGSVQGYPPFVSVMVLTIPAERLEVLDRIDRGTLQSIESRETLERLSRRLVVSPS